MALEAATAPTTDSMHASLNELVSHEARQLYHLATELESVVGRPDADRVVDTALRNLATWRATQMLPDANSRIGLTGAFDAWVGGELYGILRLGWGKVELTGSCLQLRVTDAPDLQLLVERNREDLYLRSWQELLTAVCDRCGIPESSVIAEWDPVTKTAAFQLHSNALADDTQVTGEVPEPGLEHQLEQTVRTRAAQYHFFARAAIEGFDATGEHALRRGVQEFARERGRSLRSRHESEGRPLNLHTMMSDFDYGGEGIWRFDPGTLTPTQWSQDCTHCPFAQVWRELDGLDTGYIYDMEFHVAEFMEYNPNIRVTWDKLQTRGDAICAFRFSMPADSSVQSN